MITPTAKEFVEQIDYRVQPLVIDVLRLPSFTRLAQISFLGAIERFAPRNDFRTAESRYEHSIGVAKLALTVGQGLSEGEIRLALVHALLHDIGHGPFSHSCEVFFRAKFNLDHNTYLHEKIEDASSEESKLLKHHGLFLDYRSFLRNPSKIPSLEEMFFGPINVDTIEGIIRASHFFGASTSVELDTVVHAISSRPPRIRQLDSFWKLKESIYNDYIFSDEQSRYDSLICDTLFSVANEVSATDFRLSDEAFEERYHQAISYQLNLARAKLANQGRRERQFKINETAKPKRAQNLRGRYFEVKRKKHPAPHNG